ncbi:MAG TPA: magnesium transporter [Clostridia bacterium]|jgi:magnesium transporter|nr:MAG: Magnesium transporter MgtE [Firmicutes bacterium ADurb.Bin146]HOD93680.1 magnesium transporter [Clostridia bacterium]
MIDTILELLVQKNYKKLKEFLSQENPADIAEVISELDENDAILVFRLLNKDIGAEVFAYMDKDTHIGILENINEEEITYLMNNLFMDDTVDILSELPANYVTRVLQNVSEARRKLINHFLQYPDDTAGSIMTIEYMDLKKDMTVGEAIERVKKYAIKKETVNNCYVIDEKRMMLGEVTLKELILASDDALISDIMNYDVIKANTLTSTDEISLMFTKYDILSMPIVDTENRLVGIITVDDVMELIEEETSEEMGRMTGVSPLENPYMKTGVFSLAKKRIIWLLVLMIGATVSQLIIGKYEDLLATYVVLAGFLPMLMDTSGNTGAQTTTMIVRGLGINEIKFTDMPKVIFKELRVSIIIGITLAVANFFKLWLLQSINPLVAGAVSLTLICTISIAMVAGSSLPFIAKKLRLDPAVAVSPMITTIVDSFAVLIYFSIAKALLGI